MLEFDEFHRALHSTDGLAALGVHLPPHTLEHVRGHEAYALAWFENWTRDGQPPRGLQFAGPYPPSPEPTSHAAVSGYAITGDEEAAAVPRGFAPWSSEEPTRRAVSPTLASAPPAAPALSTLSRPESPAPGWYPSPTSADHHQWWDGGAWTAERRPASAGRRMLAHFARR